MPKNPIIGAAPEILAKEDKFFSNLNTSRFPTFSIAASISFNGLPILSNPFSIILATGVSVALHNAFAPSILPDATDTRILFIKFSSIFPALSIVNHRSIKIYNAKKDRTSRIETIMIPIIPPETIMSTILCDC